MTAITFMDRARRCGLTLAQVEAALLQCTSPQTGMTAIEIGVHLRAAIHALSSTTAEIAATLAKAGIILREEVPS